ncbi:hypothetical protein CFH99_07970 [Nocardioides aromaticivorans]|uniref:Uncharacterized protein n=1 Tax=Nocardioides aromaticivorans TaxID=200618 RepID=A0ABX7PI91_9ACTN|nr:hypothetical protein CFH99_07970 [Nocardioides aromaticivorans]
MAGVVVSASARKERREAALAALVVGSRAELRLAQLLLDCMDENDVLRAQLADASARNQWLGDAS